MLNSQRDTLKRCEIGRNRGERYITPNIGYEIDQVLIDGIPDATAKANGYYIFSNITANHSISVTFKANLISPTNDLCVNATNLSCGEIVQGTLAGAMPTASYGNYTALPDVFYQFTTTATGIYTLTRIKLNPNVDDLDVSVYQGCNSTTPIAELSDNGAAESIPITCAAGTTYLIRVVDINNTGGAFGIKIDCPPTFGSGHAIEVRNATPTATDYYTADCGATETQITVTPNNPNAKVFYNSAESSTFTVNVVRADIYTVNYSIRVGNDETSHTLRIESRFPFDDIGGQMFGNVIYINNNPATNGGYSFAAYEWFKNDVSIGRRQHYSAGKNGSDMLDATAEYRATLTTTDGKTLQTCPTKVRTKSRSLVVYPNPVRSGESLKLSYDDEDGTTEKTVKIYDMSGKQVGGQTYKNGNAEIPMPYATGIYILQTSDDRSAKIVVE